MSMLEQSTKRAETILRADIIPDPLLKIIEGGNRLERYRNFTEQIIGAIWKFSRDPKIKLLPYSHSFWSAKKENPRLEDHNIVPDAVDLTDVDTSTYEAIIPALGYDYLRVRYVSGHLLHQLAEGKPIIPGGGSCIAETGDIRVINHLQKAFDGIYIRYPKETQELITWFAREIIKRNPTMTQISGATLGGQNDIVLLVESDMWRERFEECGIPKEEALPLIMQAYDEINRSVQRLSNLINKNSQIVTINFDELNLKNRVRYWMQKFGIQWNEKLRIYEVLFTYAGDSMFEAVQQALVDKFNTDRSSPESKVIERLLETVAWVRFKQNDHHNAQPDSSVPVEEIFKEIEEAIELPRFRFETIKRKNDSFKLLPLDPAAEELTPQGVQERDNYLTLVKMLRWVYQQTQIEGARDTIGNVGFADLPGPHGSIAHQYTDWGGSIGSELIPQVVRANSLDQTKAILTRYLDAAERLHVLNFGTHFEYLRAFMNASVVNGPEVGSLRRQIEVLAHKQTELTLILRKASRTERVRLENETVHLEINGQSQTVTRKAAIDLLALQMRRLNQQLAVLKGENSFNPFPLFENPFIRHAMNFLFDPDFCDFLIKAVQVNKDLEQKQLTKDEAKTKLRELMKIIYPKLEAYWGYIYGLTGYEEQALTLRNKRLP